MARYAYAPGGTLQAKGNAKVVARLVADAAGEHPLSPVDFDRAPLSWKNARFVYPIKHTGAPTDQWQEQTGEVEDGIQGDGHWQVTRVYSDPTNLDRLRRQLKERVRAIADTGVMLSLEEAERNRIEAKALRLLPRLVRDLMRELWGADIGTWTPAQRALNDARVVIRDEVVALKGPEDIAGAKKTKLGEIDALADLAAIKAYDVEAGWPVGTIPIDPV